jgi:hypothetical protein
MKQKITKWLTHRVSLGVAAALIGGIVLLPPALEGAVRPAASAAGADATGTKPLGKGFKLEVPTVQGARTAEVQKQKEPNIDKVKRDVDHEFGHVLYAQLTEEERKLWEEIWKMTLGTESELCQSYYNAVTKKNENYYAVNAMEGFCVAFSYMQAGVEVPGVISGFINSIGK